MTITNQSIEIWCFDFLTHQWSLISQLNHTFRGFYKDSLDLDMIGSVSHLFWDEQYGEVYRYEIFSVSFDPQTNSWSSITQITDTTLFTDDYITGTTTSIFIISTLLGLAVILVLKSTNKRT